MGGSFSSEIRLARTTDLDAVVQIVRNAYSGYIARIGKPPGPMLDDYGSRIHDRVLFVAEQDGRLAGLLVLLPATGHLLLDNVAVSPAFQGQGIGRALMRFAELEALRQGFGELRLYTHEKMTENIAMYAALGWEEIGRGEQEGYSRVFFRKEVRPS